MTDLSTEEVEGIVRFLGYGRPSAPTWFIGLEEGLGKMNSEDDRKNLKARASFQTAMDLYEAHLLLHEGGEKIDFKKNLPSTQVWQYMAKIMRARDGHKDWRDINPAKEYIRCRLGRCDGETFLTELSPIPAHKVVDKEWMTWFRRLDPALDSKIKQRREKLKETLKNNRPRLVICYGNRAAAAKEFAQLLKIEWQAVSPKISKSKSGQHLLLPFFGNGQISHDVIEDLLHFRLLTG